MNSRHTINTDATLLDALRQLNNLPGSAMTLFVVDSDGHVEGTLTDGDIRRALIAGKTLESPCADACLRSYRHVEKDNIDVAALRRYRSLGITLVPVLDSHRHLHDILDLSRQSTRLPLKAVLMAGGKGERLRPATLTTPKPLLQIEGKAIIDYNVEALASCGISDIYVTTRYLAEQIEAHFAEPVAGVAVRCVCEKDPLGTIGAVTLTDVADKEGDTLVMNSDLLTTISFEDMYLLHKEREADITIAVIPYQLSVPYAVLTLDPDDETAVRGIEEKPSYSYYANAGIYIIRNSILRTLAKGEHCDATDLIDRAIRNGARVTYFPIKGTWIDVGTPVDFRQAGELMRHHNSFNSK